MCRAIVEIDARQLYPNAKCQNLLTGLLTRWEFDSDMPKLKARNNRSRNFENMLNYFFS